MWSATGATGTIKIDFLVSKQRGDDIGYASLILVIISCTVGDKAIDIWTFKEDDCLEFEDDFDFHKHRILQKLEQCCFELELQLVTGKQLWNMFMGKVVCDSAHAKAFFSIIATIE